eukprot:CAMPEP_0118671892 /NCGR_PEP_ID=MMETSP0785-20121206/22245_1 /TAXON_ID=91992 /ORGANISM="Bolidomonas pacifica, Strain CCMP 1866" /LENGTH=173 /DNA_ID=CAMNT_0006566809 /DNA_START=342 /DNA_END=859 /DNA_ORIENTATION=-
MGCIGANIDANNIGASNIGANNIVGQGDRGEDSSPYTLFASTTAGTVNIYDIRFLPSSQPLLVTTPVLSIDAVGEEGRKRGDEVNAVEVDSMGGRFGVWSCDDDSNVRYHSVTRASERSSSDGAGYGVEELNMHGGRESNTHNSGSVVTCLSSRPPPQEGNNKKVVGGQVMSG